MPPSTLAGHQAEHFDILIVGAGISGIGTAYHVKEQCPDKSFVILETKDSFGGTWETHKYPGVRSDSDLYTFGYRFKPWTGTPIASGAEILRYMGEVITENDLERHIRYRRRIIRATWSSETCCWTVETENLDTDAIELFTANFLWMCAGYYRHAKGYTPEWPGMSEFEGRIVHPQSWPADLDYQGKRVIIIGSGATAATLAPAMADASEHVTIVQRSPTYFLSGANSNELADQLRQLKIDENWIHEIVRRKILQESDAFIRRAKEEPDAVKREILDGISAIVGPEITAKHFTPTYRPWRQRVAFVPDGDIFTKISEGKVSLATDTIAAFTSTGLRLNSGEEIPADIVVTATGFEISVLGDVEIVVDGKTIDFGDTVTYRGMMFSGVPNLVSVFGYFRASWTLRVDIVGDFVCRLLRHMQQAGMKKVCVELPDEDRDMPLSTWSDPVDFNPGYLMRGLHLMPRSGPKPEWRHTQDYWADKEAWAAIDLDGPEFHYGAQPAVSDVFAGLRRSRSGG
jgi:cation diffusion facilitator CzcD-associated flavoprotein CzcO